MIKLGSMMMGGPLATLALAALCMTPVPAAAEFIGQDRWGNEFRTLPDGTRKYTFRGEQYIPGIWIDPDGCEHWVMDDGAEGYMSPHLTRDGRPVCHRQDLCGVVNTDTHFATDSARISPAGKRNLEAFFRQTGAVSYTIIGHTDSRASDEYNMALSLRRANAVAGIARSVGARLSDVRGYGQRMPVASNNTAEGMAQNRRVEILCWR